MAYATAADLATWMDVLEADLPDDADRLLERASELIDYIVLNNSADGFDDELEDACCAQVEWWIETGDEFGMTGVLSSIKLGDFAAAFGSAQGASTAGQTSQWGPLAARAYRILWRAGLLFRGVDAR